MSFFVSSILPKNERKQFNLRYHNSKAEFFRSFFGRIEDNKKKYILKLTDLYSADDDDYLSAEEKVVHTTPTFVSTSSSQLVNEGDTIKLPCFVDKLGKKNCL